MTATDDATQIDPQGSGEERCGTAGIASAICTEIPGAYDNYELMRQVTAKLNDLRAAQWGPGYVQAHGSTVADLIEVAGHFSLKAHAWVTWDEYVAAAAAGDVVLALVDNWLLQPRLYPPGGGWDARHWIRIQPLIYQGKTDAVYLLAFDPLCYVKGEYPGQYQGPACMTIASVRAAIAATTNDDGSPIPEAGILLGKA